MNFSRSFPRCLGEKVAKIKVGLYEAVRDGMVVNLLLEAIPDLHLRLGRQPRLGRRSGRNSSRSTSTRRTAAASRFSKSRAKRATTRAPSPGKPALPLPRDESLREADFAFAAEPGVRAVVIKPTLTGSLDKVREQVAAAHAAGLTAVISSSIESSLGLTQLARIAAWLTPDTVPGLDTLNLMQAQLIRQWHGSTLPCLDVGALEPLR